MRKRIKKYNDIILREPPVGSYIFGGINGVPYKDIMPLSNWDKYIVESEYQSGVYFDTWNCVAESATNCIEFHFKYLLDNNLLTANDISWLKSEGYLVNGEVNFSARFVGALAGTRIGIGNDYFSVGMAITTNGLIPESRYPFDLKDRDPKNNDPIIYYQDPPQDLKDLGKQFSIRFKIYFEAVYKASWPEAIKQSPLQVFVNAWYLDRSDNLYYNPSNKINHAVLFKKNVVKQIFDSYDPFEKGLKKDYNYYEYAVKFSVVPQTISTAMTLQKYQTYLLTEGIGQQYALADLDGLLIADPGKEMFVLLNSAARLGGVSNVKVIPTTSAQWFSVNHYNLKKQKIWDAITQTEIQP